MYLGLPNLGVNGGHSPFGPASLFAGGAQGAWFDPADFSTLFQDSAGTTPVTATGQPVGMLLDKSQGMALGAELVTDPTFDNPGAWTFTGTAPLWSVTGGKAVVSATSTATRWIGNGAPLVIGKWYRVKADVVVTAGSAGPDMDGNNNDATVSGTYTWTLKASTAALQFIARSTFIGSIDNVSVKPIAGNHATQATATSRPTLQQDGSGFYHLLFDGVDDFLLSTSIDLSATDKAAVFAGVSKQSDAARAKVVELGAPTATGSFGLEAPAAASTGNYTFNSAGTSSVFATSSASFAAPNNAVLTGLGDIGGSSAILRVNGAQAASQAASQGTGNYSNAGLYVGRRGGISLPFNGRIYGLVVVGAAQSASNVAMTERFMGQRMGIAL